MTEGPSRALTLESPPADASAGPDAPQQQQLFPTGSPGGSAKARHRTPHSPWWNRLAPFGVGLFGLVMVLYQLFGFTGRPVIGIADNGDGERLACQFHLAGSPPAGFSQYWDYVTLAWQHSTSAAATCSQWITTERYPTSESLLVRPAIWLSGHLGFSATLDLRVLGLLCAVIFGVLAGLFCKVAPGRLRWRVVASLVVVLIVADAAFSPFFVSMFSEPAALLGIVALCIAWLWAPRQTWARALGAVFITAATALVAFDQTALVPVAVVVAGGLLWRCSNAETTGGKVAFKVVAVAMVGVLAWGSITYEHYQSKLIDAPQSYVAVFDTLLVHSPNPAADIKWLGGSTELLRYTGVNYWGKNGPIDRADPNYVAFTDHFSWLKLAEFYVAHPIEAGGLYQRQASEAATMRSPLMGNFAAGQGGAPRALACRFCSVSAVVPIIAPIAWLIIPIWLAIAVATGLLLTRRRGREPPWRALGELLVILPIAALSLLLSSAIGNGDGGAIKHDVPFDLCAALLIPLLILAVAGMVEFQRDEEGNYLPGVFVRRFRNFVLASPSSMQPSRKPSHAASRRAPRAGERRDGRRGSAGAEPAPETPVGGGRDHDPPGAPRPPQ